MSLRVVTSLTRISVDDGIFMSGPITALRWLNGNMAHASSQPGKIGIGNSLKSKRSHSSQGFGKRHNCAVNLLLAVARAVDPVNGDVYVSDGYGNSRIAVFDRSGKFLRQWGH